MMWEIVDSIIALTAFSASLDSQTTSPQDIPFYILPGLSNLRKLLKYDPDFSYVP